MRGKGHFFRDSEIRTIVWLLTSTDMTLSDIAKRMSCSVSAINAVNKRKNVRLYSGRRNQWSFTGSPSDTL